MAAVADLERFLERVFERTSARIFRSRVQLVQAERRVERAMEAGRTGRGASTVVPNRYRVRLHPTDLDDLAGRTGGPEVLAARLADAALAFARLHAYHLPARPTVSVVADPIVERGTVEVDASVMRSSPPVANPAAAAASDTGGPSAGASVPAAVRVAESAAAEADEADELGQTDEPNEDEANDLAGLVAAAPRAPDARRAVSEDVQPAEVAPAVAIEAPWVPVAIPPIEPLPPRAPVAEHLGAAPFEFPAADLPLPTPAEAPGAVAPAAPPRPAAPSLRNASDRPYSVRPAVPTPAQALLRVSEPGGRERVLHVEGRPLTLGRAPDNDLVIVDSRVSRHHGRFQTRHGTLVYTDLGSTNGTRVNGIRVDDIVLGAGDRLQVGDVVVVVEQLPR